MTALVVSIIGREFGELAGRAEAALRGGAERVELRLDWLEDLPPAGDVRDGLARLGPKTWIATLRSETEGGRSRAPAVERSAYLREATAGQIGWVDIEYAAWRALGEAERERWAGAGSRGGPWLILSAHDFERRPERVDGLAVEMLSAAPAAMAKIAWRGEGARDNIVAFELMRSAPGRVIAIVMGEAGLASRVLARKFGAAATYCALEEGAEAAPGQVAVSRMRELYRWDAITERTRVFGVLGDPVAHSLSPLVFNRAFERHGIDAVHLPFLEPGGEGGLVEFLGACASRSWLDLGGFSVTLPHKETARRYVGACADPLAARVGAVNTLAWRAGRFQGFNTDYVGALEALCAALGCEPGGLDGFAVDVLGAGGAARAVVAALVDHGCRVTVYNRDAGRGRALADDFGCAAAEWDGRAAGTGEVAINCTSIGMFPREVGSPLPRAGLERRKLVFDTVYNPVETRLLREAREAGCATLSGVEMFARQAAAQFEIWFNEPADVTEMRRTVLSSLGFTQKKNLNHRGTETQRSD